METKELALVMEAAWGEKRGCDSWPSELEEWDGQSSMCAVFHQSTSFHCSGVGRLRDVTSVDWRVASPLRLAPEHNQKAAVADRLWSTDQSSASL